MTYKQANSIRELVYQLSNTWIAEPLACALEKETCTKDTWKCHLYQRAGERGYKGELWALALAIEKASCGFRIIESIYNRGTTKPEYIESICIY